jgi:hypothetical protein
VAQTIEQNLLNPTLDLVWKTGLQHVPREDRYMREVAGEEMFGALMSNRDELISHPFTFKAEGISRMLQKAKTMNALINVMAIVGQNELLLQEFLRVVDTGKLVTLLFELSDIDITKLQLSEREKMIRGITEPLNAAAGNGSGGVAPQNVQQEASDIANSLGVARNA